MGRPARGPCVKSEASTQPPLIYGIALVASGTVGAGMFSLPIVTAGMWFGWALLLLCVFWLVNYLATLLLMEANLLHQPGASFDTIVRHSLGDTWALINNVGIAFVLYILLYAYFSAGGSIVDNTLTVLFQVDNRLPNSLSGLLFGAVLASLIWSGTSIVSRVCLLLLIAMFISFGLSSGGLLLHIELAKLFNSSQPESAYVPFIWAAAPYFVASFACSAIVPSLVKYYGRQPAVIERSLRYGTLIALIIYMLWLLVCFGTLSRTELVPVINAGGNTGDLVGALQAKRGSIETLIGLFSNFAIITSFLGIGLGLFDFIADRFKLSNSIAGRSQTALYTFLPPALFSVAFPKGFVIAIGYAGLVVTFCFFFVPAMMAFKNRSANTDMRYRMFGGTSLLWLIVSFSALVAVCKLLTVFGALPLYP